MTTTNVREAVIEYRGRNTEPKIKVTDSSKVARWAIPLIGSRVQESFLVAALSSRNEIVSYSEIGRGGLAVCPVSATDVFRYLLLAAAPAAVLIHNHPSGDTTPSTADVEFTEKLVKTGEFFGVRILDHVIVSEDSYFSFLDRGLLKAARKSPSPDFLNA